LNTGLTSILLVAQTDGKDWLQLAIVLQVVAVVQGLGIVGVCPQVIGISERVHLLLKHHVGWRHNDRVSLLCKYGSLDLPFGIRMGLHNFLNFVLTALALLNRWEAEARYTNHVLV
jgi:hypothetical protein